tara:strand:- start:1030 stop:1569 length:540 start_codon:yes stop_codon:yes gene_type:complete
MRLRLKTFNRGGFSLIEVSIAMAIAAIALLSIIGILPHAMDMSRDSADQTAIGAILEDAHDRLEGQRLIKGVPLVSPLFYDQQGRFVEKVEDVDDVEDPLINGAFFRIDLILSDIHELNLPALASSMKAVKMKVFWPVRENGDPVHASAPELNVSYFVSALTGPDWSTIDPDFKPKIEY